MSLSALVRVAFRSAKISLNPDVRFLEDALEADMFVRDSVGAEIASILSSDSSNPPSDAIHTHAALKIDEISDSDIIKDRLLDSKESCKIKPSSAR